MDYLARQVKKRKTKRHMDGISVSALLVTHSSSSKSGAVLEATGAPGTALMIWLVAGLLALSGALCYAELGTIFTENGGEILYLGRAYGGMVAFVFEFVTITVQKVAQENIYTHIVLKLFLFFSLAALRLFVLSWVNTSHGSSTILTFSRCLTIRMRRRNWLIR